MNVVRSTWRWFPVAMIASMGAVCIVNGAMIYFALHTFPGAAGQDDFELSQVYDRVLHGVSQQEALGWRVDAGFDADRHVVLHVADRDGHALGNAAVHIVATRPVGPVDTHVLDFVLSGETVLRGGQALAPGQWSLAIDVTRGTDRLTGTKRLVGR